MTKAKCGRKPTKPHDWMKGELAIRKWFHFARYFTRWKSPLRGVLKGPVIRETLYLTNHGRLLAYRHSGKMEVVLVCTDIGKWAKSGGWDEVPISMSEEDYLKEWENSQKKATKVANPVA